MAKWWKTEMVDASQGAYSDPNMALQIASSPQQLYTPADQKNDQDAARESKGGFLKSFLGLAMKADAALDKIPGMGKAKDDISSGTQALMYPVDKLASGAHWLYSEAIAQNLSTAIIQAGKVQLENDPSALFSAGEWSDARREANTLSPGQALQNTANTVAASGDDLGFGLLGQGGIARMSPQERQDVKRQGARFIYDTDYWRSKQGWTYTAGTGAADAVFVMGADPSTYLLGGVGKAVKGVRSVEIASKGGQLVRDQGTIVNTARKVAGKSPQTLDEVSKGKQMTKFFDWIAEPGANGASRKTTEEIAQHPIWGRGRRVNNFAQQYSDVLARTPREEMPAMYRFFAGDTSDVAKLAASGSGTLDNIGRLAENRKLVDSVKFDPAILAYFAEKEGVVPKVAGAVQAPPLALSPETLSLHEQAAKHIIGQNPGLKINAAGSVSKKSLLNAQQWKQAQSDLIGGELTRLGTQSQYYADVLGENMGKAADQFSPTGANLFGNMERAYRAGGGSFRSSEEAAGLKYSRAMEDRKGRFVTDGLREGFLGTPIRIVQAFGDRVPVGRVNHNEPDAGDRVLDMLKQVPALGKENRMSLYNQYMRAGDKIDKSKALDSIHTSIIQHLANRNGLDPHVAQIVDEMNKVGVADTIDKLMGAAGKGGVNRPQAFTSAVDDAGARLDLASRYVEDGVAYKVAPLAKTQLSQTDTLLPIKEMDRLFRRNSGAIKAIRKAGGSAEDAVRTVGDNLNTLWKASTLLRPAYVPRMISEEAMLSAIKFGFLSRILGDSGVGMKDFVLNRAQWVNAELGAPDLKAFGKTLLENKGGSYTPATGKGIDSSLSVVKIGDQDIIESVNARRAQLQEQIAGTTDQVEKAKLQGLLDVTKTSRIRVNKALPIVRTRISMEKELHAGLQGDLKGVQVKMDRVDAAILKNGGTATAKQAGRKEAFQAKIDDITSRMDDHQNAIDEFTDYANEIYHTAVKSTGRRMGEGTFEAFGYKIPQAFSTAESEAVPGGWQNSIPRDQVSSENAYTAMYARGEAIDASRAIKTGGWTIITPDQPHHMAEWTHALNRQFAQDDLFQLVAADSAGQQARAWLATNEGKKHLMDLGVAGRKPDQLVDDIGRTLDKYLPEDTGLRQKMVDNEEITSADLRKAIPASDFPAVHGQEIKSSLGLWAKDTGGNMLDRMIEKGFNRLGTLPSDLMSRQPVYLRFQEAQYKRMLAQEITYRQSIGKSEAVEPKVLEKILHESDKLARKDISQIVYDPTRTSASEALRFLAPFYSAHADGLARWGGMIAEKPEMLGKVARIYNAPVAANMVTDNQGNHVDLDGYTDQHDPLTGKFLGRKFVPIQDRTIHFRLPWSDKSQGDTPIKIQALNTILPGDPWFNPGSGPLVQVAGTEVAKKYPTAGQFMQWAKILPYGPSGSVTEAVTPKYMRSIYDAWRGNDPDNQAYQKAYIAVMNKHVAEFHDPKSDFYKKPFKLSDVDKEAQHFMNMEILEAWGSPAQTSRTPLTGTKYQFFVDMYNQLKQQDPETARDKFMDRYPEYFSFTAALTQSMGIAATESADKMAEKYKDQITADPDMASFWVGDVYNGGAFSSSVYQKQMEQHFGSAKARTAIPADQALDNAQTAAGWSAYMKNKTALDSALIRAGFNSYDQQGAEGFLEAKQGIVTQLGQQFPAWQQAFMVTDRSKVPNRIASFEKAVQDPRLMSDPMRQEMQPLAQYLIARQAFKKELENRGAKQLSFGISDPNSDANTINRGSGVGENADLANAWNTFTMGLVNSNTAFGDLYNRYLSNDMLQ